MRSIKKRYSNFYDILLIILRCRKARAPLLLYIAIPTGSELGMFVITMIDALLESLQNELLVEMYMREEVPAVGKETDNEEKPPSAQNLTRPDDEEKTSSTKSPGSRDDEGDFRASTVRPLYEKEGFLAGEKTPVWLTSFYYDRHHRVQYRFKRLNPPGTPMVKRAMNLWKWLKNGRGFPIRRITRSVDDHGNLTRTKRFADMLRNARINGFDSPSLVRKRSADSNKVIYPTLLIVMDYHDVFPTDDTKTWSVEQLILYALTFWSTVDNSLRNIQNPRVSLSIAGIVITTERNSLPYMTEATNSQLFARALSPMITHWRSMSKMRGSDIPIGSYDIIAHMTDILPWNSGSTFFFSVDTSPLGAASVGPPCNLADHIGGLIVNDDFSFYGIQLAIAQMINVLGGSDELSQLQYASPNRTWTKEILDTLSNALNNTSCMSAPKHHYNPGTPVATILAGELFPLGKQCELYGYAPDAWTCWDTSIPRSRSDCRTLYCSNWHVWGVTCSEVSVTLDGSFCNAENTKICLDGNCVDKK